MDKIKSVINKWDPIGLLRFCPDDEYEQEIKLIRKFMNSTITVDTLAQKILDIFSSQFGTGTFKSGIKDCKRVAELIFEQK